MKDIDFETNYVLLERTKNRKQQMIPLSRTIAMVLQEYLIYRIGTGDDYLFCSATGEQLTRFTFAQSIRRYNRNRGVMKTSVHLFRHTFANKWILAGGDIFRLQKILGHSSLEIVKEYVNMFNEDLKQDFDRFNPLEQMVSRSEFIKMR